MLSIEGTRLRHAFSQIALPFGRKPHRGTWKKETLADRISHGKIIVIDFRTPWEELQGEIMETKITHHKIFPPVFDDLFFDIALLLAVTTIAALLIQIFL